MYHTQEFEATINYLNNARAMNVDNINSAVATALANSKSANKTVEEYSKDLENTRLSDLKPATFVDDMFTIVITFYHNSIMLLHV
jgi:hypothetical protein